jgi:DMSO/TMAO reductase YedYZ molybdopterin-dependent catalytic subunit
MQVIKKHKKTAIIAVLLAVIIVVSFFIVQNTSQSSKITASSPPPTQTNSPSPTPTLSAIPSSSPFQSLNPYNPYSGYPTPSPVLNTTLYTGEVTQYQNYSLTPVNVFIDEIVQHPDVAIAGTQYLNQTTYRLSIIGLVDNPLKYTYDQVINNFHSYKQVSTLLCVEGWSVTMLWEGVSINELLAEAGLNPNVTVVIFHASDGYTTAVPLDYITQNNIILAYKVNNVTLPASIGFPFCLVAQNQYGYKWIKWITEIEASNDTSYLGYWESRGYPNNATVT